MPTDLNVPFTEKDQAKNLGARWDADRRVWYAPDGVDLSPLARWIPAQPADAGKTLLWRTILSTRFLLARSFTSCWKCAQRTEVFALVIPPNHTVIDRLSGPMATKVSEYIDGIPTVLKYTQRISNEATDYLASVAPRYRKDFSKTTQSIYWANHCEMCDALIGDFPQHFEPSGAFFSLWDLDLVGKEAVTLLPVHIPIECAFRVDVDAEPASDGIAEPAPVVAATHVSDVVQWLDDPSTVILDTETTGLDASAEIVEISIIDRDGRVLLDTMVRPVAPIPVEATRVHGITNDMVTDAPSWAELAGLVRDTLRDRRVVIYNAQYDLRLMMQSSEQAGVEHAWVNALRTECAMMAYSEHAGDVNPKTGKFKWHRLTDAAMQCGVQPDGAHRALADCRMTLGVLKHMAEIEDGS
jgi:DNA polymerase-3 subunit epsilon